MTLDEMLALLKQFPAPPPDPWDFRRLMRPSIPLGGFDVIERPRPEPKIQTSNAFKAAFPDAARELDAYLLERFGYREADTNMYRFSRYLSVPYGTLKDVRSIINTSGL